MCRAWRTRIKDQTGQTGGPSWRRSWGLVSQASSWEQWETPGQGGHDGGGERSRAQTELQQTVVTDGMGAAEEAPA